MAAINAHSLTAGAVVLALFAPLAAFFGVNLTGDDVLYGRLAADMAFDRPSFFLNPHPCRLGLIAPMALLYRAFGVSEWTTIALPVASTISAIWLSAFVANRFYGRSAVIYRYGTMGLADVPAGFGYGLFVVGWILVAANRVRRRRITALIAGAACAWAMATRESTAPMVILTICAFTVYGWCRFRMKGFPLLSFFWGGCIIGLPYLFYIWFYTGSPFYGMHAAQISYNLPGAPWLEPLEGARFWFRLFGFSLLRSAVEGYLIALFPVILMAVFTRKAAFGNDIAEINLYLFMAVFSPMLILSHFPTTFEYWNPVRLDLRFGSPVLIPACILAAGICTRLPRMRFAFLTRLALSVFLIASAVIFLVGAYRENTWTMVGASASIVVGTTLLAAQRSSKKMLPAVVSILLMCNWAHYFLLGYQEISTVNKQLWGEAAVAFENPITPILTDHITAQYLHLLKGYSDFPRIVTWKMHDTAASTIVPAYWADQIKSPETGAYKILWYPVRAKTSNGLWGGKVPPWVIDELQHAQLLSSFLENPEISSNLSGNSPETAALENWRRPGLYLIDNLFSD
jgi:hypothetical protein